MSKKEKNGNYTKIDPTNHVIPRFTTYPMTTHLYDEEELGSTNDEDVNNSILVPDEGVSRARNFVNRNHK
ncbi:MAG: hypothetical protein K0R90_546 [Oscillospiraceae bacterium]|jgi:hypothetical protein|nr:hypothetical protein [Oscillospiraceae bacterium]